MSDHAAVAAVALEAALKARAPGVHASTPVVRRLVVSLGEGLGLAGEDLRLVDLCAEVRDVGMLALPDRVVLAEGALAPRDWEALNRHPILGAELLAALPATRELAASVRSHHERWDGGGYPDGLAGEAIPRLSRIIAVCDAFVAIASDRPHRRGAGTEAALEHVLEQRGSQFDPAAAEALVAAVTGRARGSRQERGAASPRPVTGDLKAAIARLEVLPVFAPARERLLSATANGDGRLGGEVVATIESDIGLVAAVLRDARPAGPRPRPITNVADAVAASTPERLRALVSRLPVASFPWRTPLEASIHQLRVHSQAVARAAERIVLHGEIQARDDLRAAVLLHDVGKLVLEQQKRDGRAVALAPEARVRHERRSYGTDHASLGGLLLSRWGLPRQLSDVVARHHSAEGDGGDLATLVRLADMVAHQAQGHAVDRRLMLALADACGLSVQALRDVLFDLPHAGGSERRRAEPSPLSKQETAVLCRLARGLHYKEIAVELGVAPSTIRSHLHNAYKKLGVGDRAQAVLRATEMAWI